MSKDEGVKVMVVGGPFAQRIDPVLKLVPSGEGRLAAKIADALERRFSVSRLGNFPGAEACDFQELMERMESIDVNVLVFLPHLPNILVDSSPTKIRVGEGEDGNIYYVRAPKIVEGIKTQHPEVLLVPFKLADPSPNHQEVQSDVVRWMLGIHSALAVYSVLGESNQYFIIDALANEVPVAKANLPEELAKTIANFVKAIRRRSERVGEALPDVKYLKELIWFSRKMQPAFETIMAGNVIKERWPGNFSFRCTHGFLSSRADEGFAVTVRNVAKTGITEEDFVFVSLQLSDGKLQWSGRTDVKPSIDSPVHRIIYQEMPWVKSIVHGHLKVRGDCAHQEMLPRWPCGSENEGKDIVSVAPKTKQKLWVVNVEGHGFVALIGDENPREALEKLSEMEFARGGDN